MIRVDLDPLLFLFRDGLLFVDRLEDARNRCARKTQEQDALARPEFLAGNLRRLQDGHSGLAGTGAAHDELVPVFFQNILLRESQIDHPSLYSPGSTAASSPFSCGGAGDAGGGSQSAFRLTQASRIHDGISASEH